MGGEAVPERMGRDALRDATLRGDVAERPLGGVARERPVGRGAGEEIRAPGVRVAPVGAERGEQAWAQRDVALVAALPQRTWTSIRVLSISATWRAQASPIR